MNWLLNFFLQLKNLKFLTARTFHRRQSRYHQPMPLPMTLQKVTTHKPLLQWPTTSRWRYYWPHKIWQETKPVIPSDFNQSNINEKTPDVLYAHWFRKQTHSRWTHGLDGALNKCNFWTRPQQNQTTRKWTILRYMLIVKFPSIGGQWLVRSFHRHNTPWIWSGWFYATGEQEINALFDLTHDILPFSYPSMYLKPDTQVAILRATPLLAENVNTLQRCESLAIATRMS